MRREADETATEFIMSQRIREVLSTKFDSCLMPSFDHSSGSEKQFQIWSMSHHEKVV